MQISPVVPTGTREKIVYASFSSLALWPKFKTLLKRTCAFHSMALMTIKKNFVNLLSGFFQLGMENI